MALSVSFQRSITYTTVVLRLSLVPRGVEEEFSVTFKRVCRSRTHLHRSPLCLNLLVPVFAVGRGRQEHQPSLPPSINVYLVSLDSLLVTGAAAPWFKVWCCATQLLFWASFPFAGVLVGMPLYGAGRPRPHWEAVEPYPAFALARPRPRPNLGLDREKYLLEGCAKPLPAGIELPLKLPALRLCKGGLPGPVRGCDDFAAKQAVAILAEVSADVVRSGAARSFWVKPGCRAKSWEEEQWQALARTWVGYLQPLLNSSPFFQDLGELAEGCLIRVLRTKAAGTLRRICRVSNYGWTSSTALTWRRRSRVQTCWSISLIAYRRSTVARSPPGVP